jgi:hypothetical protein
VPSSLQSLDTKSHFRPTTDEWIIHIHFSSEYRVPVRLTRHKLRPFRDNDSTEIAPSVENEKCGRRLVGGWSASPIGGRIGTLKVSSLMYRHGKNRLTLGQRR